MQKKFSSRVGKKNACIAITIAIYVAAFVLYIISDSTRETNTSTIGWLLLIVSTTLVAILWLLSHYFFGSNRAFEKDSVSNLLAEKTLDIFEDTKSALAICDDAGKVLWSNAEMRDILGIRRSSNANISIITDISFEDMQNPNGLSMTFNGCHYEIRGYKFLASGNDRYLISWTDKTNLEVLYGQLQDERVMMAYIIIDNLEDISQSERKVYRSVSNEVEKILKAWSDSVGGVLLEYEKDRYLFLFEAKYLKTFTDDKFSILDATRNITVGDSGMPITLSIGVSSAGGSLGIKEESAMNSLEVALQRGGDQAVVRKEENELEFYGGKFKGVQKNSKVKARVTAKELVANISRSKKVLIMGHKNMDFDALGSCVGLARICMHCGNEVHIIADVNDNNLKKCFELLSTIPEYDNIFVDVSTAQDMITSETLLIVADVNNKKQFESPEIANSVFNVIVIDHHRLVEEFDRQILLQYIEPTASSCCELVSEMIEQIDQAELKQEEATLMLAGILLDTKQFSRNIGTRTFASSLFLRSSGADTGKAFELFRTDIEDYLRDAKFKRDVEVYRSGFIIAVDRDEEVESSYKIAAAKAADGFLNVDGIDASFAICYINDVVNISSRSNGDVNVQIIMEKLGGGGHFNAAAAQIENVTIDEAIDELKKAIDEYIK